MPIYKPKKTMHGSKPLGQRGHVLPKAYPYKLHKSTRLRTRHVLLMVGFSHSRLYEKMAEGSFPQPDSKVGYNKWAVTTILAYLAKHNPAAAAEYFGGLDSEPPDMGIHQQAQNLMGHVKKPGA